MTNEPNVPPIPSFLDNPYVFWGAVVLAVVTVIFKILNTSTEGFGNFLTSIRTIRQKSRDADIMARDQKIENLSRDLRSERTARQADRQYFEKEITRRDELLRKHIAWDWKVYQTLVHAELWPSDTDGPPPLF
jgi:hypothetical protein